MANQYISDSAKVQGRLDAEVLITDRDSVNSLNSYQEERKSTISERLAAFAIPSFAGEIDFIQEFLAKENPTDSSMFSVYIKQIHKASVLSSGSSLSGRPSYVSDA